MLSVWSIPKCLLFGKELLNYISKNGSGRMPSEDQSNYLPDNTILALFKLKEFANDKFNPA